MEEHGPVDLEPAMDPFARLIVSVINQQLSVESAAAIEERVFNRFQVTPQGILAADGDALREAGLSASKVTYVRNLAQAFDEGTLSKERLDAMSDDEVIDTLTEVKGVGVWTAKMALIFVLGREDVFPVEDLGVRRGMEVLFGELTRKEMIERAESWRPYRSYASLYLWRVSD